MIAKSAAHGPGHQDSRLENKEVCSNNVLYCPVVSCVAWLSDGLGQNDVLEADCPEEAFQHGWSST